MQTPEAEFASLIERSTDEFARSFLGLLSAVASGGPTGAAVVRVADTIGETMTLADLFGRRRVLLELDHAAQATYNAPSRRVAPDFVTIAGGAPSRLPQSSSLGPRPDQFAASPIVPNVPFSEAFKDIIRREPRLAANAEEVAELYRTRHAFALARSAEQEITERVQGFISKAVETGVTAPKAATVVAGLGDWTRSYGMVTYRTNLTTAYTAGRFKQAQEPGVLEALPAMERTEILDSAVRRGRKQDGPKGGPKENHKAINGLILETRDPRWAQYAPPAGYGCRGSTRLVPRAELSRRGLLTEAGEVIPFFPRGFEAYQPHPNFGKRRADLLIYGG